MKADRKLDELGIEYETVEQDNPSKACDDAARERGLETSQIVKSLIIEAGGENFHVLIPGDRELSESKLGEEYRMVSPEESRKITGFESGTVHPFSTDLKHLVDERIFEQDRVSHTTGDEKIGVILDSGDFSDAVKREDFDLEVRDLVVSNGDDYMEIEERGLEERSAKFIVDKGYRGTFLELSDSFDEDMVLELLESHERHDIDTEDELKKEILERAEDETHLQKLMEEYADSGELPEEEGFELEEVIDKIVKNHPDAVEDYRSGKDSAMNFFIGQVMQATNGKADAGESRELLEAKLDG
ncbi:MAG: YbaK/EbsC family protein [Candidatus Nanohaloarchaea archaeon]